MTKSEVLKALNCTQAELARLLGISRSAVAQWPEEKSIPDRQLMRLRYELCPDALPDVKSDEAA